MTKTILYTLVCFFILLLPCTTTSATTKPVIVSYEDILNEPMKDIDPDKPMVAITYDDGPFVKYTPMILDILQENHAYATFFVLGSRIEQAPELLERMILEGHEIGNHTFSHYQLTRLNANTIEEEINKTQQSIYDVIHRYPSIMRPPYGDYNANVEEKAKGLRIVRWSVDSEDWRSKNAKTVVERVMKDVQDRSIILLHDQYESTVEATSILVPKLIEEGYQLVTVSELFMYE